MGELSKTMGTFRKPVRDFGLISSPYKIQTDKLTNGG